MISNPQWAADYRGFEDSVLLRAVFDTRLGHHRARAITELADRALRNHFLLADTVRAISSDRRIGLHQGSPVGWFGADHIFLSGDRIAMNALLTEMNGWEAVEQADLVRHWAGREGLAGLTRNLVQAYDWTPRYSA